MAASEHTIVQYFPDVSPHECGYCKQNGSTSQGMWAYEMSVSCYQQLIDRNWRRSGMYCYQPIMDKTCCPQYMIRCDVNSFFPSKHQKKNIKRVNRFLMTGKRPEPDTDCDSTEDPAKKNAISEKGAKVKSSATQSGAGADPAKPKCMKAKELRRLRKLEKQSKCEQTEKATSTNVPNKVCEPKTLEALLADYDITKATHKFEVRLVRSHPASEMFKNTKQEEFEVYKKYQMDIHKDPESKLTMRQFERFLVESPLHEETRDGLSRGSFRCQYVLDGKIIGVEVMDILTECVSSKYFFYDPDYGFLNLGTYSTLRSIDFVKNKLYPKSAQLRYYLMGYYIHACQKMRYKGQFASSYLLCPETYVWVDIDKCTPKLDKSKYSRLNDNADEVDADKFDPSTIDNVTCLYQRCIAKYGMLRMLGEREDREEVIEYAQKVGRKLATSILLYREE